MSYDKTAMPALQEAFPFLDWIQPFSDGDDGVYGVMTGEDERTTPFGVKVIPSSPIRGPELAFRSATLFGAMWDGEVRTALRGSDRAAQIEEISAVIDKAAAEAQEKVFAWVEITMQISPKKRASALASRTE